MVTEQTKSDGVGLPAGTKIGKYEIVERIGMGGQAVVYKGYDALLDRHVALKQISTHLAGDEKFMERFRKEAQILARLGSEQESVVTIHELIEDEHGLFIVMEFLGGVSLERVLVDTNGPSEVKATLQIIWRLAAALHAVHNAGIIHRDLKPSNIIIAEGLRPKITDFGVAATSGDASMTLGTTKYMAPELYSDNRSVDGRVDMYSLGFIAYEMLVGRPKFKEIFADVVRDKHGEQLRWMKWHGNMSVEAPTAHEVNPSVPEGLSEIVARMMAKDPDKRFANMEELGRAIKLTFSPRAKAGAAKKSHHRPRARAGAARAPRPSLSANDSGMALVPPDAGDELEVSAEPLGAATAPLPSRRTGRKVLLFVVLPLVLLGLIGLGAMGISRVVQRNNNRAKYDTYVAQKFNAAVKDMEAGIGTGIAPLNGEKFASAITNFEALINIKPAPWTDKSRIAVHKASVYLPICEAYQAIVAGDWSKASVMQGKATKANNALQNTDAVPAAWTAEASQRIKSLDDNRMASQSFREAVDKAQKELDAEQFDEARRVMEQDLVKVPMTQYLDSERDKFLRKVDEKEFRKRITTLIAKGDSLADQGKLDQAEAAYLDVQELLNDSKATLLASGEADQYRQDVNTKLKEMTGTRTLSEQRARVAQARAAGDKRLLIVALMGLDRIEPSQATKDEIKSLRSDVALAEGRKALAGGDIAAAKRNFEEAIQHNPNNAEAKAELANIAQAKQHADLVSRGDTAFAASEWQTALDSYLQAAKTGVDDALTLKINECKFRIKFAAAEKLRRAGKYDEATSLYEDAKQIKPSASALINNIEELMVADKQYNALMAEGDTAQKQQKFAKAREYYEKAQKIRNTAQVQEAIKDTRYGENLARGIEAWNARDYPGAKSYFKIAQGFKDTQEVKDWLNKAEKALKDANG